MVVLAGSACAACASPPTSSTAATPAGHLEAVLAASRQGDPDAVCVLVEALVSDDPAIRLVAIARLEERTGTSLGYDPADPASQRQVAVDRWVARARAGAGSAVDD